MLNDVALIYTDQSLIIIIIIILFFFDLQTINDVALGVTQAGLSKYLNRRYGEFLSPINFIYSTTIYIYIYRILIW